MAHPVVEQLDALTSLRFFAAISVLLFHYNSVQGSIFDTRFARIGYTGVTFFFILSGFILAHNYHQVHCGERSNLYRYFVARISRIYPVFLLSLIVGVPFFLSFLLKVPSGALKTLAASSFLLAPLGLHAWLPGASCTINCPSWSISVEFFFYVLFPFLLSPVMRNPVRWLALTLGTWATVCIAYLWMWFAIAPYESILEPPREVVPTLAAQFIKYFPIGRLPEFVLGVVLYRFWKGGFARIAPGWTFATFIVAGTIVITHVENIPEILLHDGLTAVAWVPLVLAAANLRRGPLCTPFCVFLGRISFALYLFHLPVFDVILALDKRIFDHSVVSQYPTSAILLTALLAIVAAACVYISVEKPSRQLIARCHLRV